MRNLLLKGSRFLVLGSLLLLAGCFRPAGESIQPTSEAVTNEPFANSAVTPTSGEPVITLLSPSTEPLTTESVSTTNEPLPVITAITLAPPTETFTATAIPQEATATLQIITPGISLGLVTPDTATPLPSPEMTETPMSIETTIEALAANGEVTVNPDCTYTVQPGDNLYRIAVNNNTSLTAMRQANPQLVGDAPILQIGDVLNLPDCAAGSTVSAATPAPGEPTLVVPVGSQVYTVKPGDVLGAIASRYGVSVNAILQANNLSDPNRLSIGQQLIIPPKP